MKPFQQILVMIVISMGCLTISACAQENSATKSYAIFVGSTPCNEEVSSLHYIPAEADCDLIKWSLTLYRNAPSKSPTRFALNREWGYYINNRTYEAGGTNDKVEGKWKIVKGTKKNPEISQLNPDQPEL
jgi:hypothetical protein